MKKHPILVLGTLLLCALAHGGAPSVDASKSAKMIAPMEPLTSWGGPVVGGGIKGNSDFLEGSLFLVQPLLNTVGTGNTMEGDVLFVEPYFTWADEGELGASLALGFRHLFSDQSVSDASHNTIAGLLTEGFFVGGNVFIDYTRSRYDNDFWQTGFGIEAGTRYLTLRANYYLPLSDDATIRKRTETETHTTKHTSTHTVGTGSGVVNGNFVQNFRRTTTTRYTTTTTTRTFELFEEPLQGFDVELALLVPGLDKYCDLQLIAGYYNLEADRSHRDFVGWRAGVEFRPVPAVVLFSTWYEEDHLYRDNWVTGIRLEIPLGGGMKDAFSFRRHHLAERLYEPVHRKNSSITTSDAEEEQTNSSTTTTTTEQNSTSGKQVVTPIPTTPFIPPDLE